MRKINIGLIVGALLFLPIFAVPNIFGFFIGMFLVFRYLEIEKMYEEALIVQGYVEGSIYHKYKNNLRYCIVSVTPKNYLISIKLALIDNQLVDVGDLEKSIKNGNMSSSSYDKYLYFIYDQEASAQRVRRVVADFRQNKDNGMT